jgi:MFS superfamily sulfate permease-like transporter
VRSGANVEAGARTRVSAILHGVWLLVFVAALPWTLGYIPLSALAAVLVFTGYKLAYPKVLPTLQKYGWGEVLIYAATIVTIVLTDLLTGVLTGLGMSLAKLLYSFSHLEVVKKEQPAANRVDLYLKGAATLIRLPQLAAELETLKPNTHIHVHIDDLDYIDHACIDLLTNWDKQHRATGGSLEIEWEGLANKYQARTSAGVKAARELAKSAG